MIALLVSLPRGALSVLLLLLRELCGRLRLLELLLQALLQLL